ncbi:hypothetical protein AQUCO_04000037v1 [Aquilegia coerulea]|uniref:Transcription initiation factor TFIID subunit 1 histone acetyltransferase domain-containing protein n=1 Tax=Aquilegia coerulea TaxID=218851 RepID=A0A2G5CR36_AQUCA|nr:hypothetical protein AQUCO_04000037v1 [Aquilegia coerulea]
METHRGGSDHLLGFMFGNVDEDGDIDVDYLDDDAKDHLVALGEQLGSSLMMTDIDTPADVTEEDYDVVDYEDIDEEQYEEEGQQATFQGEEDYLLLSKNQYFSAGLVRQKTSVFDEENYDDEDEQEDLQEPLSEQKSCMSSLPVSYMEDGVAVLRFSEIFGNHEAIEKRKKRSRRYPILKEKYNQSFDAYSGSVEDDDEAFLRGPCQDSSFTMKETSATVYDEQAQGTTKTAEQRKDSSLSAEPMKESVSVDLASGWESPSCAYFCPLEQHDWENDIIWGNVSVPSINGSLDSCITSEIESEVDHVQEIVSSENLGLESLTEADENHDHRHFLSSYPIVLESFGSRVVSDHANILVRKHPQQLRLESCLIVDVSSYSDGAKQNGTNHLYSGGAMRKFSKFLSQNMDLLEDSWLDNIIWDPSEEAGLKRHELILDLQDEHMLFELPESKDVRYLHAHAGAMITEPSVKPQGGDSFYLAGQVGSSNEFNLSNDKYYSNSTASLQLKSHLKNRTTNSDLQYFAGDLENILDAEECGVYEVGNHESSHNEKNPIKGLEIRRHPLARKCVVCRACGQMGHIRTNRNCPSYSREGSKVQVESINDPGKRNSPDPSTYLLQKTSIKNIIPKGATSIALLKTSENSEKAGSKTEVLPLKLKCGKKVAFDAESGPQSVNKISRIVCSNKLKHGDGHVRPIKLIIKPLAEVERDQTRQKIIIKLPRGDTTVEQVKQETSTGMQEYYRKTKMMNELSSVEMQRKAYKVQGSSKNDRRLPGRDCSAKRQSSVELGTYDADYAPQTKRWRGGARDVLLIPPITTI